MQPVSYVLHSVSYIFCSFLHFMSYTQSHLLPHSSLFLQTSYKLHPEWQIQQPISFLLYTLYILHPVLHPLFCMFACPHQSPNTTHQFTSYIHQCQRPKPCILYPSLLQAVSCNIHPTSCTIDRAFYTVHHIAYFRHFILYPKSQTLHLKYCCVL